MNEYPLIENGIQLLAIDFQNGLVVGGIIFGSLFALMIVAIFIKYGSLWLQAYMSNANVSMLNLIGMSLRRVNPSTIVKAHVMVSQAGLTERKGHGLDTASMEAHVLAGGDVMRVVIAIIAANRANIDLDFDRAAAIDLAGRDLQEAVRTSIFPKVIDCPDPARTGNSTLSAIAKNGVELLIHVRVTVRTNLDQLIGGATEETIIARVGQGIVSAVGSMESHMEALEMPDRISRSVHGIGVESNTAYEIVSIDIANIDVGENIGARLQSDQAEADTRIARAFAEIRRAEATAERQEMIALVTANRAELIKAEAGVPLALSQAFRDGQMHSPGSGPGNNRLSQKPLPRLPKPNDSDD